MKQYIGSVIGYWHSVGHFSVQSDTLMSLGPQRRSGRCTFVDFLWFGCGAFFLAWVKPWVKGYYDSFSPSKFVSQSGLLKACLYAFISKFASLAYCGFQQTRPSDNASLVKVLGITNATIRNVLRLFGMWVGVNATNIVITGFPCKSSPVPFIGCVYKHL